MDVQERYRPHVIGVNGTFNIPQSTQSIGGFLCTVSGTLNATDANGNAIITNLPVTAGQFVKLPFLVNGGNNGGDAGAVVLSGGAAGTLAV